MKPYWFKRLSPAWRARLMRVGFNLHPAFRATGGRVLHVSHDFQHIRIKLPLLRRTRNIVGSMYRHHPTMIPINAATPTKNRGWCRNSA